MPLFNWDRQDAGYSDSAGRATAGLQR
jgi:hypothetical protein